MQSVSVSVLGLMPKPNPRESRAALTPKQWRFVEEFNAQPLAQRDARKAAVAAGYSGGSRLDAQIKKLMDHPNVRAHIMEGTQRDVRKVTEISGIDQAWLIKELHNLWETPISALLNPDGSVKPINEMSPQAQKLIASFKVRRTRERTGDYDENGQPVWEQVEYTEVRLVDRLNALKTIGQTTDVNAFGTRQEAEAKDAFTKLMGALAKSAERGAPIDITPKRIE